MFFHRTRQKCNYTTNTIYNYFSIRYAAFNFTLSRQVVWNIIAISTWNNHTQHNWARSSVSWQRITDGRQRFVENKSKHDNSSCRSSADARRANCAAPERAGTNRRRPSCLYPYPRNRDASGARTRPLRSCAIRGLSSDSWRNVTWAVFNYWFKFAWHVFYNYRRLRKIYSGFLSFLNLRFVYK